MNTFLNQVNASAGFPWLSFNPVTGLVPPDAVQTIEVTFDSSVVTQTGQYSAPVQLYSNDPLDPVTEIPMTMTVISSSVTLEPAAAVQSGDPGTTIAYSLNLTNNSSAEDTFELAAVSQDWTSAVSATVGPVAAGAAETVTVTVSIPLTAAPGAQNVTTVLATSQQDSSQSAQATLTTTANSFSQAVVTPANSIQSGSSGASVNHTLWLTNSGNITDTYYLTISGNSWPILTPVSVASATVIISTAPLTPGASESIGLVAMIPTGTPIGATDTATVTITSAQANAPMATVTLTTVTAASLEQKGRLIYLPTIIK
jgi:uncharacterized membrane protein